MSTQPDYKPLFYWVQERENIRLRKEVDKRPYGDWTKDEIFATYRFCNVRREDDRVTIWIKKNIREPYAAHPHLWFMMCIARQLNWPDTLANLLLEEAWPHDQGFEPAQMTAVLNERKRRGEKVYTGAYMISAPQQKGQDKQEYICEHVLGKLWQDRAKICGAFVGGPGRYTLRQAHAVLMRYNGWGPFMAYQAIADMRFCHSLLGTAEDIGGPFAWAAAGPGTIRGLNRLHGRPVDYTLSQERALIEMRKIYQVVETETGVAMDFSDVPNILCETDKYLRVKNGEGKPRALYVPGRGS